MTSQWGKMRKAATEAGAFHADGGPDRRDWFSSRGSDVRDAYDKGYSNRTQEMARESDKTDRLKPLTEIIDRAECLSGLPSVEAHEVAELVRDLATYLLEKEHE